MTNNTLAAEFCAQLQNTLAACVNLCMSDAFWSNCIDHTETSIGNMEGTCNTEKSACIASCNAVSFYCLNTNYPLNIKYPIPGWAGIYMFIAFGLEFTLLTCGAFIKTDDTLNSLRRSDSRNQDVSALAFGAMIGFIVSIYACIAIQKDLLPTIDPNKFSKVNINDDYASKYIAGVIGMPVSLAITMTSSYLSLWASRNVNRCMLHAYRPDNNLPHNPISSNGVSVSLNSGNSNRSGMELQMQSA